MQASTNAPQAIYYYHYYYSSKAGSDPSNMCSMCANHGDFHFHTTKIPRFFPTWNLNMEWHKGHFLGQKVRWCRRSYDIHERLARGAVILNSIKRALSRIPNSSINCICCISKYLIPTTVPFLFHRIDQDILLYCYIIIICYILLYCCISKYLIPTTAAHSAFLFCDRIDQDIFGRSKLSLDDPLPKG